MENLNARFGESAEETSKTLTSVITRLSEGNAYRNTLVPRDSRSCLKEAGVVEMHDLKQVDLLVVPDVSIREMLATIDGSDIDELYHEPSNGPLAHYDAFKGLATPCIRMGGKEGLLAFRPKFSMPFRGEELTWSKLAKFHSQGRG